MLVNLLAADDDDDEEDTLASRAWLWGWQEVTN